MGFCHSFRGGCCPAVGSRNSSTDSSFVSDSDFVLHRGVLYPGPAHLSPAILPALSPTNHRLAKRLQSRHRPTVRFTSLISAHAGFAGRALSPCQSDQPAGPPFRTRTPQSSREPHVPAGKSTPCSPFRYRSRACSARTLPITVFPPRPTAPPTSDVAVGGRGLRYCPPPRQEAPLSQRRRSAPRELALRGSANVLRRRRRTE